MYQLCLGEESLASVIDRIAGEACAVVPTIDRDALRRLTELVFRARVRKTEACGRHAACRPGAAVWGAQQPAEGETAGWLDLDPEGLPAMFGAAAADLARVDDDARAAVEAQLAAVFHAVVRELLFANPRCGHAEVCNAEPIFPLDARRR